MTRCHQLTIQVVTGGPGFIAEQQYLAIELDTEPPYQLVNRLWRVCYFTSIASACATGKCNRIGDRILVYVQADIGGVMIAFPLLPPDALQCGGVFNND